MANQLDNNRCAICGWPLAESASRGCVRGDCLMRPIARLFYDPARVKEEYGEHAPKELDPYVPPPYRIVCLCGSTRFIEQFATATWVLELEGNIVLGCTLLPLWFCGVRSHFAEVTGTKEQRDAHHLRKIDLSDEVLVLDIGGYIGESTRNEIAYAEQHGKPVRYASKDASLLAKILPSHTPEPPQ